MNCGVYLIVCRANRRIYVGSSVDIVQRWRAHLCNLRKGRHHSRWLQRSWDKYGARSFDFVIWSPGCRAAIRKLEAYWIKELDTARAGFNQTDETVAPWQGKRFAPEHCAKIAAANTGTGNGMFGKPSAMRGRKHTQAARRKMSIGIKASFATRNHRGANNPMYGRPSAMLGKKHTRASRLKMAEATRRWWKKNRQKGLEMQLRGQATRAKLRACLA
jgi:group I intron endonuclease